MQRIVIALFMLLGANIPLAFAVGSSQEWVAVYNSTNDGYDTGTDVTTDAQGNIYVTGTVRGTSIDWLDPNKDILTTKYGPSGEKLWEARYNGNSNGADEGVAVVVDVEGNVYVLGRSINNEPRPYGQYETVIIRYSPDGSQQWVASWYPSGKPGAYYESWLTIPRGIALDKNGNIYATAQTHYAFWSWDIITIKCSSDGVIQWAVPYIGGADDSPALGAIAVDGNGSVYIAGNIGTGWYSWDFGTIKYDANGNLQWVRTYNGLENSVDIATSMAIDPNGNIYVTGYSVGSGTGYDYATVKYSPDGEEQWVARYNGLGNETDIATSIVLDANSNVYVTGYSAGIGTGYDYVSIKYDSTGVEQWVSRYNGAGNSTDIANQLAVDANGNVYVTGGSYDNGTAMDYVTIKYDPIGIEQWVERYNGTGNGDDISNSIAVDANGNAYVTGESYGGESNTDFVTIKYGEYGPNRPPLANASHNQTTECAGTSGALVMLDGSGSTDPDGNSLTYTWTWEDGSAEGANPTVMLPFGTTVVTLTVSDGERSATDTVNITVQDTTPSTLILSATPDHLWPPNRDIWNVTIGGSVSDACSISSVVFDVIDEYGLVQPTISDFNTSIQLQADRDSKDKDEVRVYTINATATDVGGNKTKATTYVYVSKPTR